MSIRLKCPACGRVQHADDTDAGQLIVCLACGNRYNATPASAPPTSSIATSQPESTTAPAATQPLSSRAYFAWVTVTAAVILLLAISIIWIVIEFTKPIHVEHHTAEPKQLVVTTHSNAATTTITTLPATRAVTTSAVATTEPSTSPATLPITPTTAPATTPSATTSALVRIRPVRPESHPDSLDDDIGSAINRGINYMIANFKAGRLLGENAVGSDYYAGLDALAVYSLLQAGQASHDDRLGPHTQVVEEMLKVLKSLPMDKGRATYARSLRAAALSIYNRPEDRISIRADNQWLLHASMTGGYTYEQPPLHVTDQDGLWDNSNSQYGALGIWSACESGAAEVPTSYWQKVEDHWLACQLRDGQWGYSAGSVNGRLSMTVAGITTLFITQDYLGASKNPTTLGRPPFIPALLRGLNWLETGDHSIALPFKDKGYNLYGLERAALASGFKYFGTHDWYRELSSEALVAQLPSGAWGDQPLIDTPFTLLFLSRGRHPIFINKLRFDGYWANRPRDIANLARYASYELERPLNWQVVSLQSDWTDWMDSPILYIASHEPPFFSQVDLAKLRAFALNGGLIFTHADGGSDLFNKWAAGFSKSLFPKYSLQDLPPTHPIYSTLYNKVDPQPPLQGISNGSRLLLVHSPTEINRTWQLREWKTHPPAFQMGVNIFLYAAGKVDLRNKLKTTVQVDPNIQPIATVPIALLQYPGNSDPEPAAWPRFARQFLAETSIRLSPIETRIEDLRPALIPVAHLTGTEEISFSEAQIQALRNYVNDGGVLLIDACGGSSEFNQSIREKLLPAAFPSAHLQPLSKTHPILSGSGDGMMPVTPKLRPFAAEQFGSSAVGMEYMESGKGAVIFCGLDLTTALLGTNHYSVIGCENPSAYGLTKNEVLWAIERDR